MNVKNILDYLENSANKYPEKIAFADGVTEITYESLVLKAKIVATKLIEFNYLNKAVAIINEKSVESIIMFMAVVYSGNFYALVNPDHLVERKNKILNTLDNSLVIISKKYEKQLKSGLELNDYLYLEDLMELTKVDELKLQTIRNNHLDIDHLYAMFTSGSTGEPKGIVVGHRSVIDFIEVFVDTFSFTSDLVIGNQAPFDFDVSVKDIYIQQFI